MNRFVIGAVLVAVSASVLLMCRRGGTPSSESPKASKTDSEVQSSPTESPSTESPSTSRGEAVDVESEVSLVETGIVECDSYIERYLKCEAIPLRQREIQRTTFEAWKEHVDQGKEHDGLRTSCEATTELQGPSLAKLGC